MTLNEIKKKLYKEEIYATYTQADKTGLHYIVNDFDAEYKTLRFLIPFDDIGDGRFIHTIFARLLIRYIVYHNADSAIIP